MPSNFRSCPRTISWLGSVAQLAGTPPLPNSNHDTPRPAGCLRASLLPINVGGCPLWHCPPPMPMWRVDAPGPFPRVARAHYTAPVAFWRYGSRFRRVARAHYTIPAPLGPLAYSGRLVRCPGCPLLNTHLSRATLPAGQWTPAPYKKVSCLLSTPTTKRPFCKFN